MAEGALIRQRLQAERRGSGPARHGQPPVAGYHRRPTFRPDDCQRLSQRVELRQRGRVGSLVLLHRAPHQRKVKVEAPHPRRPVRLPCPWAYGDEGQARRDHERLLRAGHDHVQAPGIRLQLRGEHPAYRVDHQQRAVLANDAGDRADVVQDAGRGLVVRDQHGADRPVAVAAQDLRHLPGIDSPAPLDIEALHAGAVGGGNLREAVAESADHHRQHPVAR